MGTNQLEMVVMEELIPQDHPYRRLKSLIDFEKIQESVEIIEAETGAIGFGKKRLVMCLILQFMEDLSDREFDRFIAENIAGKWFADFGIREKTPDYTTICKFRKALGCKRISRIFNEVKRQLQLKGYGAEVFTFVDATALTSKLSMWEERDKAIQDGYERFNNEVIKKYSADKDVRIGSKGKNKYWFGYKKHVAVDTQSGIITKVAVTKANVSDSDGARHVLPKSGAVLADKGYVGAIMAIKARALHPMVILRNNMKEKNKDLDRWISGLRSPYERTFSKQNQRVRYRGIAKNQAAEFLYAVAYNFRRLLVLEKTCLG